MAEEDRISVVTGDVSTNPGLVYDPVEGIVRVSVSTPARFPVPSKHRAFWYYLDGLTLAESMNPLLIPSAQENTLATQSMLAQAVPLFRGDIVSSIGYLVTTAAAGTVPTTVKVALLDSVGTVLAVSANATVVTNFALGYQKIALSAPYTVLTSGVYYIAILKDGTYGSTEPKLASITIKDVTGGAGFGTIRRSWSWASQTDFPAVAAAATITGTTAIQYYLAALGTLPRY